MSLVGVKHLAQLRDFTPFSFLFPLFFIDGEFRPVYPFFLCSSSLEITKWRGANWGAENVFFLFFFIFPHFGQVMTRWTEDSCNDRLKVSLDLTTA